MNFRLGVRAKCYMSESLRWGKKRSVRAAMRDDQKVYAPNL